MYIVDAARVLFLLCQFYPIAKNLIDEDANFTFCPSASLYNRFFFAILYTYRKYLRQITSKVEELQKYLNALICIRE
jgi:hypothetical protein